MINQEYSYPVFVPTTGIATAGHIDDLQPGQLGLFSRNNYSIVTTPKDREEVFLAFGSTRRFDKIGDMSGFKSPEKSAFFKVKDVINFELSLPKKAVLSNKIGIGFTGSNCSDNLKFECDKNYVLKVYLKGSPVLRYMGKAVESVISYNTGCCADGDCTSCPEGSLDPQKHTKAIVALLNSNVELKQLGLKAMYVSDTYTAAFVQATGTAVTASNAVASVTVGNGGKGYESATVTFTGGGGTGAAGTPVITNGVITGVTITAGGSGYTSAPTVTFSAPSNVKTKYQITVPDLGDTPALQLIQTNAGTRGTVTLLSRSGIYSTYTYCGDTQAPSFTPAQSISLAVCGACATGFTLTAAKDVITIVRPLAGTEDLTTPSAQNTYAGTIATAYSAVTPTSATFLSQNGATASVSFKVATGTVVNALLSDTVIKGITIDAECTPTSGADPIAWTATGTAYKAKRTLKVTLTRQDCGGADRVAELQAFYATNPDVVPNSIVKISGATGCEDCYNIQQWSKGCLTDECLATDEPSFNILPSFDGAQWVEVESTDTPNLARKTGITIEASMPEISFGNDSFDPNDFYEDEPIEIEVAWELSYPNVCEAKNLPTIREIRHKSYSRQTGEWVIRKLIEWSAYHWGNSWNMNPRIREAFGQEILSQVDRKAYYKVYYPKFVESRAGVNTFAEQPRIFEPLIAFKESDPNAHVFENMFNKAIASQNITLNKREDLTW